MKFTPDELRAIYNNYYGKELMQKLGGMSYSTLLKLLRKYDIPLKGSGNKPSKFIKEGK